MQEKGLASILLRCCSAKAGVSKGTPAILPRSLPVGGATTTPCAADRGLLISIHAPRGGSDSMVTEYIAGLTDFNPRSPWGERRSRYYLMVSSSQFQSTLPVGGATGALYRRQLTRLISIHAPRGGATISKPTGHRNHLISIHAPRGGSDVCPGES